MIAARSLFRPALLAVFLATTALPSLAVRVDPTGRGQALIYPYYTARPSNGTPWDFLFSVVNPTAKAKVVKVRYREALHGRALQELNLYLGANDVWTGAVVANSDGSGGNAVLITADLSCTDPVVPTSGALFPTSPFSGSAGDGAGEAVDRTQEGYVEMIEMGTLSGATADAVSTPPGGIPKNCASVTGPGKSRTIEAPEGGLYGGGYLINVQGGWSAFYPAFALADLTTISFYTDAGQPGTDFDSAQVTPQAIITLPASSGFGNSSQGYLLRSNWTRGVDAVSAVLMASAIENEYVLDPATASQNDWIVTLPTKRFYVDGASPAPPFTRTFSAKGACDDGTFLYYSRAQESYPVPSGIDQGAPPPPLPSLCWASNTASLLNLRPNEDGYTEATDVSKVFGSHTVIPGVTKLPTGGFLFNGFAIFTLAPNGPGLTSLSSSAAIDLSTGNVTTGAQHFAGLPVIGFSSWIFNNGLLQCNGKACKGTFGMGATHRYVRSVTPVSP